MGKTRIVNLSSSQPSHEPKSSLSFRLFLDLRAHICLHSTHPLAQHDYNAVLISACFHLRQELDWEAFAVDKEFLLAQDNEARLISISESEMNGLCVSRSRRNSGSHAPQSCQNNKHTDTLLLYMHALQVADHLERHLEVPDQVLARVMAAPPPVPLGQLLLEEREQWMLIQTIHVHLASSTGERCDNVATQKCERLMPFESLHAKFLEIIRVACPPMHPYLAAHTFENIGNLTSKCVEQNTLMSASLPASCFPTGMCGKGRDTTMADAAEHDRH